MIVSLRIQWCFVKDIKDYECSRDDVMTERRVVGSKMFSNLSEWCMIAGLVIRSRDSDGLQLLCTTTNSLTFGRENKESISISQNQQKHDSYTTTRIQTIDTKIL